MGQPVVELAALAVADVAALLARLSLTLRIVAPATPIPGSYWGAPEAGLVGNQLYARSDTPLHSILHEAGHFVCMSGDRRARLEGDAGGDDLEECAACYLQVLLADALPEPMSRSRMCQDMDAWGYSFRQGNAAAWFAGDGADARDWLAERLLIDTADRPTYCLNP